MIKICGKPLLKPFFFFETINQNSTFQIQVILLPDIWERSNIIPFHENDEKLVKKQQPMSLLPIFGKHFEKTLNEIYHFLFNFITGLCSFLYRCNILRSLCQCHHVNIIKGLILYLFMKN